MEKCTYTRVSDYLKREFVDFREFAERTRRRHCKESEKASRTSANKVNRMVVDVNSQVDLSFSVTNFLCLSKFVQYFCSVVFCYLTTSMKQGKK